MGNSISFELQQEYDDYVRQSNMLLVGMAAPLYRSMSLKTERNESMVQANARILRAVATILLFLYEPGTYAPAISPFSEDDEADPVKHLEWEWRIVSRLRKVMFNSSVKISEGVSLTTLRAVVHAHIVTFKELATIVNRTLAKYHDLEFYFSEEPYTFDLNKVDFSTSVDIQDLLTSPITLTKNSASNSIVHRGSWKGVGVYAKTFKRSDPALVYEKEIYRFIRDRIGKSKPEMATEYEKHFILPLLSCSYGKQQRIAIFTEDAGGVSVNDLLKMTRIPVEEYLAILFQITYIVDLLYTMGISHNDIHLGNVIVTIRGTRFSGFKGHNDRFFDISPHGTMYNCKIYDFDRASSIVGVNRFLDESGLCKETGQCNRKDSQKDLFNILMMMHMGPADPTLDRFRSIFWKNMFDADPAAAAKLKPTVDRNIKDIRIWQSFCVGTSCDVSYSKLLEIPLFVDIFSSSMQEM